MADRETDLVVRKKLAGKVVSPEASVVGYHEKNRDKNE